MYKYRVVVIQRVLFVVGATRVPGGTDQRRKIAIEKLGKNLIQKKF